MTKIQVYGETHIEATCERNDALVFFTPISFRIENNNLRAKKYHRCYHKWEKRMANGRKSRGKKTIKQCYLELVYTASYEAT